MESQEYIKNLADKHLKDDSFFIVDVISKGVQGKTKFLILLDADGGVNIDDCADLSRAIASDLELEDPFENPYVLEVSSPGLDHPLKLKRQYSNNVGRKFRVQLKEGEHLEGKLEEVNEKAIMILEEKKEKKKTVTNPRLISFEEIEKAKVLVSFK